MTEKWRSTWNSSDYGRAYGDLFAKRASGAAPEMESSKAAAKRLNGLLRTGDRLLDAGCGAGHYLVSLQRIVDKPFIYTGVDATPYYVEQATKIFAETPDVSFCNGDLFNLPFPDKSFDVVMCNNVFLHLPSIAKPFAELCRVAKRHVQIRTLVGNKSYVVRDVTPQADGADFDNQGEPIGFHFLNIYGTDYIHHLVRQNPLITKITIESDHDFDASRISDTKQLMPESWDYTNMVGTMQASGMILQPWSWINLELAKG